MRRITAGSTPSSVILRTAREGVDMGRSSSCGRLPAPGQKLINAAGQMVAHAVDQIGEISLEVHAVQLAALDQGEEDRCALAASVGAETGLSGGLRSSPPETAQNQLYPG